MANHKPALLTVKNLSKDFVLPHGQKLHVLKDINLEIYPEEVVAIIGPSGSGKSTLLRIMIGLVEANKGKRFYKKKQVSSLLPNTTMVFQNFALYPWLTVEENIAIALKATHTDSAVIDEKVKKIISLTGLSGFEETYPREISGGMKQRVGLARALICEPEILFMDEPFSAVDAFTAEGLRSEVLKIWSEKTSKLLSVVLISHDIREVAYMADRIIVIEPNPGHVKTIIKNPLKRPRDYHSLDFIKLTDELHEIYTKNEPIQKGVKKELAPIAPLLSVSYDEILGFLQYLNMRKGSCSLYQIGSDSSLLFDQVILAAEAADQLNFVEVSHQMVSLTELGIKYLNMKRHQRQELWKTQISKIPLFARILKLLKQSPNHTLDKEEVLNFLMKELPLQDAQIQWNLLKHWNMHGSIFHYHKKRKQIYLK